MQKDIDIVWTVLERRLRQRYLEHTPIPRGLVPKIPIASSTLMTGSFPVIDPTSDYHRIIHYDGYFLRSLRKKYPRCIFVHVDVRERDNYNKKLRSS
jgi:hypothetical protein